MKEAKLTREQSQKVRKHLILGSAVIEGIKTAHQEIKGQVFTLSSIVSGKIVKKYRGKKWLSSQTGIARKNLGSLRRSKFESVRVHTRKRAQKVYSKEVNDFLERDDNPRKSDVKMSDNTKKQTRVLTDYMANLYMKFVAENSTVKMSRATFCHMRPTHILTTIFISRSTCLCTKHQNMALTLKSLRKERIDVSANPESFAKEEALDSKDLKNKLPALVKFSQWKKIEVLEKEKKKYVTQLLRLRRTDKISLIFWQIKQLSSRVT
jgi:DNA-binding Xre family transcriptional regulator